MSNPDKQKSRRLFWLAMLIWGLLFVTSFVSFQTTEPTGDSFARGLNRVAAFFGWQLFAGVVGFIIWFAYRRRDLGRKVRWAARAPPALFTLLVLSVLSLFAYGLLVRPAPSVDTHSLRPLTEPGNMVVSRRST